MERTEPTFEMVRAFWLAHKQGRVERVLEMTHPLVIWLPMTRPGRTVYAGHAGTRDMLRDHASSWLEVDDLGWHADSIVEVTGRILRSDSDDVVLATVLVEIREGLIYGVDSRPRGSITSDEVTTVVSPPLAAF